MISKQNRVGYCTNVHAGISIDQVLANLKSHSLPVKANVAPNRELGIGLWLSSTASRELRTPKRLADFKSWLEEAGLLPFTINGFPFGDFHSAVVKHKVYSPDWSTPERLDYTVLLAELQNQLLPPGVDASISTLPLGWPGEPNGGRAFFEACGRNLLKCANRLHQILESSGREICVCLEPEPGCLLDTCNDVVNFFNNWLLTADLSASQESIIRKHIGVCHDICHSAVMFEPQSTAFDAYRANGIRVGKIQVSSAVEVDFDAFDSQQRAAALAQLKLFAEPRYLHQTSIQRESEQQFFEDLPLAISQAGENPTGKWRVHFHVPIHIENFDLINTTQNEIENCLAAIQASGCDVNHFEIETYAWNVLPAALQSPTLSSGIAAEMNWFIDQFVDDRSSR